MRTTSIAGAAALLLVGPGVMVGMAASAASETAQDVSVTAADELPPFAVEDFEYPRAEQILEEQGFLLKRGDGHIVLADCAEQNVLKIGARGLSEPYVCFRVTGDEGSLTLELPRAYSVTTNDYATTEVTTTASGESTDYLFGPGEWNGIGEGVGDPEAALIELRVTR